MDYKKYSLENLETWLYDAMSCEDATPQEIYDVILNVVKDEYYTYKQKASESYELLALLNGNKIPDSIKQEITATGEVWDKEDIILSCDKDDTSPECKGAWNDFWGVDENNSREYNLREAEYYNKRAQLDADYEAIKAAGGYEWTPLPVKDKVKKWVLPVQQVKNWVLPSDAAPGSDVDYNLEEDYVVNFPDDLLEAANLKEGDMVEWVDQGDGSYLLRKV